MRALAFLVIIMAVFLVDQVVAKDYLEKCIKCFLHSKFEPVCAYHRGTYWNKCALDCDNAIFLRPGFCTVEDLLDNEIIEKFD